MSRAKKTAALHAKTDSRRAPHRRATSERGRIDQILAEAKLDNGSRRFFARAAVRYADLMKRLADK